MLVTVRPLSASLALAAALLAAPVAAEETPRAALSRLALDAAAGVPAKTAARLALGEIAAALGPGAVEIASPEAAADLRLVVVDATPADHPIAVAARTEGRLLAAGLALGGAEDGVIAEVAGRIVVLAPARLDAAFLLARLQIGRAHV